MLQKGSDDSFKHYTKLKANLYYFELPLLLNFKKKKHTYSIGALSSILFTDRLFEYSLSDDFSNNAIGGYYAFAEKNRALTYFGVKPKNHLFGYVFKFQKEFDKWAFWSISVQHTGDIFDKKSGTYKFNAMSVKSGVTFLLYRKTK